MSDVAAQAGVSRTLVSFVLDGKPGASEETRQRVLAVAAELGYRHDSVARGLALKHSRTLGVITDVRQLFQADLVTSIYPAAEGLGYEVLLSANLHDRPETVPVDALLSHRCGALILLGPRSDDDYLHELARRVPVVVVGRRVPASPEDAATNFATVRTNDAKGIRQAVAYLVQLGHRNITHVDGGTDPGSADRRRAYRAAMRSHGLAEQTRIVPGAHNEEAGFSAARAMLQEPELPTAVIASNDRCALGLLDVFTRAGIDVPGQLSLVGYDDARLSEYPRINLTTVHQDSVGLARDAVQMAVGMLERNRTGRSDTVLEPSLVIRGTTAPPRIRRDLEVAGTHTL
ncbi:LacI family DNA-binding transcriptional regulator [Antrihabitans sp. YC2-6]|uniref:LacI family DNA-binding transcriptional regulator n=1 Tax=Antrihabitans sp. YC2-6 TaxID=2799498 RepID=UPI0018F3A902|nr:LacI family DNA-binding transcriptional regulator [Antrihabitans sp. YC2-6]MBJ8343870.1 LacI family DNA-binding transcriptional regulator [Antrihabitans sp. YC2-6]